MQIISPAFRNSEPIPAKYTCDGENINPPLTFKDVPQQAVSLVLIMDDLDVPKHIRPDGVWDHWVIFNIPAKVREVLVGQNPPGVLGLNTSGQMAYTGPCPPDKKHRYFFKLYAIDAMLKIGASSSKKQVEQAMAGHIIEQAEYKGTYERKTG